MIINYQCMHCGRIYATRAWPDVDLEKIETSHGICRECYREEPGDPPWEPPAETEERK